MIIVDDEMKPAEPTPQQESSEKKEEGASDNRAMAYVAYIIFFIPLLTDAKDDPFVKYHTKQGLILFLAAVAVSILGAIPVIGWFIIWPLGWIFIIVVWIIGLVNVSNNAKKPLPLIGKLGEKFNF